MPIYELNYRGWEGQRTPQAWRWLTIARTDLQLMLKRKVTWFFLIIGLLPVLYPLWVITMHSGLPTYLAEQSEWSWAINWVRNQPKLLPPVDADLFHSFYRWPWVFVFLLALVAGSGRVANDIKTNAFLFYLSRPVGRLDYVLGKFTSVAGILSCIGLLPAMVLVVLAWLLKPEPPAVGSESFQLGFRLFFAVVLQGVLTALYWAAGVLFVSAFSRSSRAAGVGFVALVFLSGVLYEMCATFLGVTWAVLISFRENIHIISRWFFGLESQVELHPAVSLLAVVGVIALGVLVLSRRVRAVEVQT